MHHANTESRNSHQPPSSDGLRKQVQKNREKSDKKQGAQKGHEGKTLQMVVNPDKTVVHKVEGYCGCGKDLKRLPIINIQRRQEIDLVEKLTEIIEHRIEVKQCSCGKVHIGEEGRLIRYNMETA